MAEPIKDLPGELWKPVVGWEEFYAISNKGRLWARERRLRCKTLRITPARLLKQFLDPKGYYTAILQDKAHSRKRHARIHALVLEAFIGPRPSGYVCRHLDGNRTNNVPSNLAWGTCQENAQDAVKHGTMLGREGPRGERQGLSKLKAEDIPAIRARYAAGERQPAIARDYEVSQTTISCVVTNRTWWHIT